MHTNEENTLFRSSIRGNKYNSDSIPEEEQDFIFRGGYIIKHPELPKFERTKIYISPNTPSLKLDNALNSYARKANSEDILLLVDITLFGSAKDGFILTKGGDIFFKKVFSTPSSSSCYDVSSIYHKNRILRIEFKEKESWHIPILGTDNDIDLFCIYLTKIVIAFKENLEHTRKTNQEKLAEENTNNKKQEELKYQQRLVQLRYFGSKTNNKVPSPSFFGEPVVNNEQQNATLEQNSNSILDKFFLDNSDGIISKLKESGLSLTASALQNDANIAKIANFIYNLLPSPIRFVVNVSIIEDFLLKNRFWLIEKLK